MSNRINKTENELLADILKKWGIFNSFIYIYLIILTFWINIITIGVKDPDNLIQKCIDNDHIKCNDHGAITILILKDCNLVGPIPSNW
jgi:hypothetical protein